MIPENFQFFFWWKVHAKFHYILKTIFCWTNHSFPWSSRRTETIGKQKEPFYAEKVKKNKRFDSFENLSLSVTTIVNFFCICFLSGQIQNSFTIVVRLRPSFPKETNFPFFFTFFIIKQLLLFCIWFSSSGWSWEAVIFSTKPGF